MSKEKCKALEVKIAGTQHRHRRPSAQKLLQEVRAPKRHDQLIGTGQFKPFGSANSCPQIIHSKAWYRWACSKTKSTDGGGWMACPEPPPEAEPPSEVHPEKEVV
jgi:hypothetical protein